MKAVLTLCMIIGFASLAMAGGWQAIQQDYLSGKITAEQRAEFAITLLTNPDSLPAKYQIDRPIKDATGMILDVMTDKNLLNPYVFDRFSMLLARQFKQKSYYTPQGHFCIHFDTTDVNGNVVYQPTVDINPQDGIPDYVNRTGEYFERAWSVECDSMGYDTPPSDGTTGGGTNLYDVYMHHYSGAYGVTWPETPSSQRPGRGNDYISYIFVDPNYDDFGYSDRTLPMKVTSAHEFFHSIHMAYNAYAGSWFMENCSTWMEDVLWDSINDNYFYLPNFMNNTNYSLTTTNGSFEYGAFVWPTYLSERFGNDLIRTIWEWTISSTAFNAMVQVLDEYATGLGAAYPEFSTWNFLTGSRSDGLHYDEGAAYRQVRMMRTHTIYPVANSTSNLVPSALGCNYIMFTRGSNRGRLHITFNGNNSGTWAVPIVKSITANQHEFGEIPLDGYGDGEIVIDDFQRFSAVTIIPCLFTGNSLNYTYSAHLDTTTDISDALQNLPHKFTLSGNYPNPFNGQTIISFSAPAMSQGEANLAIYDQLGRKVYAKTISIAPGPNDIHLGSADFNNLASGLYFYRIVAGNQTLNGRMTYLK